MPEKPHRIYKVAFASVYPMYIAKAEKKDRTKKEVNEIIRWLTGYSQKGLEAELKQQTDFETFFAKALKGIWRCARFENAAAKRICACFFDSLCDFKNLFTRFDRTWPGNDRNFRAADGETIEFKNRILLVELA